MKRLIVLAFLIFIAKVYPQAISFEKIIYIDSTTSKEILFERLNSRLIELVGSQDKYSKSVVQADKDLGVIKYKQGLNYHINEFMNSANGEVFFDVNVYFKKGRYKIVIDNIVHKAPISLGLMTQDKDYPHEKKDWLKYRKRKWVEIKEWLNSEIPKMIVLIEKSIDKPLEMESKW
jgi:hypothetical protein